jgi:hypothetical protein
MQSHISRSVVASLTTLGCLFTLAGCFAGAPAGTPEAGTEGSSTSTSAAPQPAASPIAPVGRPYALDHLLAGPFNSETIQTAFGPTSLEFDSTGGVSGSADCRTFTATIQPAPDDDESATEDDAATVVDDAEIVQVTGLTVDETGCDTDYVGLGDILAFIEEQTFVATVGDDTLDFTTVDGQYALSFVAG